VAKKKDTDDGLSQTQSEEGRDEASLTQPLEMPDPALVTMTNADYNRLSAEHGNAHNMCEVVHGKSLLKAIQRDGFVELFLSPLPRTDGGVGTPAGN